MIRYIFAALAIASLLVAQDEPYRSKPLPAGPNAKTKATFDRGHVSMWRELLTKDCEKTGALADPWREDIEELIDAYANIYGTRHTPTDYYQRLYVAADRLASKDCKLPIALLAKGDANVWRRRLDEAAEPFFAVGDGHRGHDPVFDVLFALGRERMHRVRGESDAEARAAGYALQALVNLAASDDLPKDSDRYLLTQIMVINRGVIGNNSRVFIDRLIKRVGENHFIVLVLRSSLHRKLAWDARGKGTASSITEKKFGSPKAAVAGEANEHRRNRGRRWQ